MSDGPEGVRHLVTGLHRLVSAPHSNCSVAPPEPVSSVVANFTHRSSLSLIRNWALLSVPWFEPSKASPAATVDYLAEGNYCLSEHLPVRVSVCSNHIPGPTSAPPRPRAPRRRTRPPTPRDRAGPFGVRGSPTGASAGSPPGSATHLERSSRGAQGARARSNARRRPPRGVGEVGDRAV